MDRLQELMEQFPQTPRSIVIKADVLREGLRDTPDLRRVGRWALSSASIVFNAPEEGEGDGAKDGSRLPAVPHQFSLKAEDVTIDIFLNPQSPYEIREEEEGRYFLCRGGEPLEEVSFLPRPAYFSRATRDGTPLGTLALQRGPSCITVCPFNYCEYTGRGEPCLYCCVYPSWDNARKQFGARTAPRLETLAEAVAAAHQEIGIRELKLSGGALTDTHKEAEIYLRAVRALLEATGPLEEVTLVTQAFAEDDQKRLRDVGVTNVMQDLEVWDAKLWESVIPGKARAVGREEWLRRLVRAVEIFGRGRVATNFVAGIELAAPNGFRTPEEAIESHREAFRWLLEQDILPVFTFWSVLPGSRFSRQDVPPTDYFLRLGEALHHLMLEYDVYPQVGFRELGQPPDRLNLFCWYCYSMSICRDYPRLARPVAVAGGTARA